MRQTVWDVVTRRARRIVVTPEMTIAQCGQCRRKWGRREDHQHDAGAIGPVPIRGHERTRVMTVREDMIGKLTALRDGIAGGDLIMSNQTAAHPWSRNEVIDLLGDALTFCGDGLDDGRAVLPDDELDEEARSIVAAILGRGDADTFVQKAVAQFGHQGVVKIARAFVGEHVTKWNDRAVMGERQMIVDTFGVSTPADIVEAARREYQSEGRIEIDDDARFSALSTPEAIRENGGVYVSAWVWVETGD